MADSKSQPPSFWDERYGDDHFFYGEAPNAYLAAQRDRLRRGMRALVPGDGEGRNGVWLAEQGLEVVTIDLSAAGVSKARRLAEKRGVTIDAQQADLTQWNWPLAQFDVVASIFLHLPSAIRTRLHRSMLDALRPGGVLIIEAFRPEQLEYRQKFGSTGGPQMVDMLFSPALLREDFAAAEVVELESTDVDLSEGSHHFGLCAVVRGVFRRPETAMR